MKLSECTESRDNNFNLIRFIAATLVLITHSYALSVGSGDAEPLRISLGTTWGAIAVDMFFVTSGFLITTSFFARNNIFAFAWARILRIFPALIVAVLFCVFVVGLFFTTNSIQEYFSNLQIYKYCIKNTLLMFHLEWVLPGVFENNPYKGAVNGSLWTLPLEIKMYVCLAVIFSILIWVGKKSERFLKVMLLIITCFSVTLNIAKHFQLIPALNDESQFIQLFSMFFMGATFYVCRVHILLSARFFYVALIGLLCSVVNKDIFFVLYVLSLPYLVFYVAYVPTGVIRKFNNFGDYSYGLYIYAFPVQQSIAALIPGVSVGEMVVIAFCITIFLAFLSWHLVEKKCLKMKNNYIVVEKKVRNGFS